MAEVVGAESRQDNRINRDRQTLRQQTTKTMLLTAFLARMEGTTEGSITIQTVTTRDKKNQMVLKDMILMPRVSQISETNNAGCPTTTTRKKKNLMRRSGTTISKALTKSSTSVESSRERAVPLDPKNLIKDSLNKEAMKV